MPRPSSLKNRQKGVPPLASSGTAPGEANRVRFFFAATIAGIALYVVLDAIAQSLPPHYSPISQAESDLAVGPYGYVMAVNFVNRGIFSLLFLYGLARSVPSREGLRTGLGLFGVWAVGALILAVSPTDVSGPATVHGFVHLVVATLAFLGAAIGTVSLSRAFRRDPGLQGGGPLRDASGGPRAGLLLRPLRRARGLPTRRREGGRPCGEGLHRTGAGVDAHRLGAHVHAPRPRCGPAIAPFGPVRLGRASAEARPRRRGGTPSGASRTRCRSTPPSESP